MKVAVVGGRDFNDSALVRSVLDELDFDLLISGGARGADTLDKKRYEEAI